MNKHLFKVIATALGLIMLFAGCSQKPDANGNVGQSDRWEDCKEIYTTVVTYTGEDDTKEYLKIAERSERVLRLLEENVGGYYP